MANPYEDLSWLGTVDDQQELLRQQLQLALRRSQPQGGDYRTAWGASLGGLGDIIRGVKGGMDTDAITRQQQELLQRAGQARSQFTQGNPLSAAQGQQMTPDIASAMGLQGQGDAMSAALRNRPSLEQMAMMALGSGDKTLGVYGQAMLQQAAQRQEMDIRRQEMDIRRQQLQKYASGPTGIYNVQTGEVVPNTAPPPRGSEMAELRRDLDFDRNVEALSKRLENVPSMRADLQKLLSYAQRDSIPGVGRVAGRLPASLQGDDAIKLRQAARGVVGALLKEQSGQTVSAEELTRKLEELGLGPGATEDEFKYGLVRLANNLRETVRGKEAGYDPEVIETARKRGLVTSADLPLFGGGSEATNEQTATSPASGSLTIYRLDGTPVLAPNEEVKARAIASKRYKAAP